MTPVLHSLDTLRVRVTVIDATIEGPFDLSGATLECAMGPGAGPGGRVGVVTVVDAPGGVVDLDFEPPLFVPRTLVELRVSRLGEAQTVWANIFVVQPSIET